MVLEYKSNKSRAVKTITIIGILIIAFLMVSAFNQLISADSFSKAILYTCVILLLLSFVVIPFLLSPRKIRLLPQELKIEVLFPFHKKKILIRDIHEIKKVSLIPSATISTKGYFGFIGSTMDDTHTYINNIKDMILIECSDKKYIYSCENPEEFIKTATNIGR